MKAEELKDELASIPDDAEILVYDNALHLYYDIINVFKSGGCSLEIDSDKPQ